MSNPILVVEDNDDLLLLFKLILESAGYQVVTATNGIDALNNIGNIQPQLVLMDIMMPNMNGIQASRNIKQNQDYQSLPVLLVSAVDRLQDEQLRNSKADGIIYKPFDLDDLVMRVARLISDRSKQDKELEVAVG